MNIKLFYDKECPFCNSYANYVELKENHDLEILNARTELKSINELKVKGFDINDGFIIVVDEKNIYQGSDAIIFLNKISNKKIYFLDNLFFKKIIYPILKAIRKLTLKLLNKKQHL